MHAKRRESFLFPAIMKFMAISVLPVQALFLNCSDFLPLFSLSAPMCDNLRLRIANCQLLIATGGLLMATLHRRKHMTSLHPSVPAGTLRFPARRARNLVQPALERTRSGTVRGCAFAHPPLCADQRW